MPPTTATKAGAPDDNTAPATRPEYHNQSTLDSTESLSALPLMGHHRLNQLDSTESTIGSIGSHHPLIVHRNAQVQQTPFPVPSRQVSKQTNSFKSLSLRSKAAHSSQPKPPKQFKDHKHFNWIIAGSFLLCFNAGFINTLTLSTMHVGPSAHVTGMVARVSMGIASHNWQICETFGIAYLCFLTGAMISGLLIQHQSFYLGRNYGRTLLFIAMVLAVAVLLENLWDNTVYYVWACALAMGTQNALTSKYSGNVIRTTHLTGATTDLGIAFGHILKGRGDEWWRAFIHINSTSAFFLGGIAGWHTFKALTPLACLCLCLFFLVNGNVQRYEHFALLVNITIVTFCGMAHTCYVAYHENLSFIDVLEASEDIKLHRHRVEAPRDSDRYTFEHSPRTGRLHHHHHHHDIDNSHRSRLSYGSQRSHHDIDNSHRSRLSKGSQRSRSSRSRDLTHPTTVIVAHVTPTPPPPPPLHLPIPSINIPPTEEKLTEHPSAAHVVWGPQPAHANRIVELPPETDHTSVNIDHGQEEEEAFSDDDLSSVSSCDDSEIELPPEEESEGFSDSDVAAQTPSDSEEEMGDEEAKDYHPDDYRGSV